MQQTSCKMFRNSHAPTCSENRVMGYAPIQRSQHTHMVHAISHQNAEHSETHSVPRRMLLSSAATAVVVLTTGGLQGIALAAGDPSRPLMSSLQRAALDAYSKRDFGAAVTALNGLIKYEPSTPKWREMRAQSLVDGKNFSQALQDFDKVLQLLGPEPSLDRARVLSGRGLAFEGISDWPAALKDYTQALDIAKSLGADPDPYILNSMGNCHASLGEWQQARDDYLASANGFQSARREEGRAGSLQMRLDGAVFAFSNAALMLAQVGDDVTAVKEMQSIARRAPGSADMRIALAAMLWSSGQEQEAEAEWEFACNKITVGCVKYQDEDWLRRIRRWPPVMIARLKAFLALRSTLVGVGAEAGGEEGGTSSRVGNRKFTGFSE